MPTKGPSYRYGNTNGARRKGRASNNTGFAWAKGFNKGGLGKHFEKHGKEFSAVSEAEYAAKATHFANAVDRKNYKCVKDCNESTYKYDARRGRYAIITKDGYVVTYHKPKRGGFWYSPKKGKSKWISF